jgi:hypothetical protein
MRKLPLISNIFLLMLAGLLVSTPVQAKKKKRKKVKKVMVSSVHSDSIQVVRAPGSANQTQLDSMKSAKMKLKKSFSYMVVSLTSHGAGIDLDAESKLNALILRYQTSHPNKVTSEIKTWGREGDKDYCLSSNEANLLQELTTIIQSNFKSNTRVLIKENTPCRE